MSEGMVQNPKATPVIENKNIPRGLPIINPNIIPKLFNEVKSLDQL